MRCAVCDVGPARSYRSVDGVGYFRCDACGSLFAHPDFLARVEALARRSATVVKETVLRVGDLELDLMSRTANRNGRNIELLPREFQLLEYLVRNEGNVVSRAMLLQNVWDLHFDPTTNIIDVYVGRLRRKIDGQQSYPLIHTVRGVGYRVCAPD